ncbi:MAG TPA: cytochrome C [Planctomycetaceae bacterium]|nr:cytochrome C [Planctomycetaceae bacterium]
MPRIHFAVFLFLFLTLLPCSSSNSCLLQADEKQSYADELPRVPALSPVEAMKHFNVAPTYQIQQTATEPLLNDPVAMCFDEQSRLFVAEMRGYSEQSEDNLGQIRLLEDVDGDGIFDKSHIFAEGLSWPTAIICYRGGVFVGAAPDIFYLKDTNGDHKADLKEIVFTGFGKTNVQGLLNCFRWGLDNRIHGAASSSGGLVRRPDQPESAAVNLRGRDFSFDPETYEIQSESGGAQHGMSFDDWGRKFVCSNSDHLQMVVYDDRYAARNPYLTAPNSRKSIADDGGQAPVFRSSPVEPWRIVRTRLRVSGAVKGVVEGGGKPAGYFTGSTGVTIYRGDAWPKEDQGLAIIGDVGSNIVHRKRLIPDGVLFHGTRIDDHSELLTSSDIWFRPVQFENGPDGALHILDMYREVIEHPASLPPMIKQHLDLTSGRDRGRLYRLVPEGYTQPSRPAVNQLSSKELVDLLQHPNSWHRETASRLLFERQDQSVRDELIKVASGDSALGRMHALATLDGLSLLTPDIVAEKIDDPHPQVRRHAIMYAEQFANNALVKQKLEQCIDDQDPEVIFQLAFTLGEFSTTWRTPLITKLLKSHGDNEWIRFALFTSIGDQVGFVLKQLANESQFVTTTSAKKVIDELVTLMANQPDPTHLATLVKLTTDETALSPAVKQELLQRYLVKSAAQGRLDRSGVSMGQGELQKLLDDLLVTARLQTDDKTLTVQKRVDAIRLLAISSDSEDHQRLMNLIDPREPDEIQTAALSVLAGQADSKLDSFLLSNWESLSPKLRKTAVDILLSRDPWTVSLLTALNEEKLPISTISLSTLQILAQSETAEVRDISNQLKKRVSSTPRASIVTAYEPVLNESGGIDKGRVIFEKNCSSCHRLEGKGQAIGPNLASFRNRGKMAILINILDPNREVTPEYLNYVIITDDGRSHTGILSSQNATTLTLKRAEGKETQIRRIEIEDIRSTGMSLMPEGLEKEISQESMADLLTYLMQAE